MSPRLERALTWLLLVVIGAVVLWLALDVPEPLLRALP